MKRQMLKGAIVEKVVHSSTKRTGVVRLDKSRMLFHAQEKDGDPNSPQFSNKDGSVVRNWLDTQLSRTSGDDNLEWQPIIEVERTGERRYRYRDEGQTFGESMGLEVDRFYVALTKDKVEWLKLPWEACDPDSSTLVPENERITASSTFKSGPKAPQHTYRGDVIQRFPHFSNGDKIFLLYTPELWKGLKTVVKAVGDARKTLDSMIGTKDGITVLAEIGQGKTQLLLGPGTGA